MNPPWRNLTGLLRAAAILGSLLGVSLGLCGVNAVLYSASLRGDSSVVGILLVASIVETAAILVSAAGLIVVLLLLLFSFLYRFISPARAPESED